MSSALKPALPATGGQTSAGGAPVPKGMSGAPVPATAYGQPLAHVPAHGAGLPHALGLPATNSAANMSANAVPGLVGAPPQPPQPHASPAKGTALPPAAASAGVARPHPPYMSPPGAVPHPRDDDGTALPPSQNSAQLMAAHRAAQQQHQQQQQQQQLQLHAMPMHHQQQQQQQQPQAVPAQAPQHDHHAVHVAPVVQQAVQQPQPMPMQSVAPAVQAPPQQQPANMADRFKQTVPPQANGTSDPACHKTTVPAPPADPRPDGSASAVHNHVPTATDSTDNAPAPPNATSAPPPDLKNATAAIEHSSLDVGGGLPPTKPPQLNVVPKAQPTMKLATTPRTSRKQRDMKPLKQQSESPKAASKTPENKSSPTQKGGSGDGAKAKATRASDDERKSKRTRTRTQPYQSPLPELALISKLSGSTPARPHDEKLIVFYKNEFLAVRNAEGGFYVCQAVQNVYKSSPRIRIRWLSQDKQDKIYIPDFYDFTDFDCILTNLNMERVEKGKYNLPKDELERTENILKRALAVESGGSAPSLTEEHPDGLDLSLFRDESQLKKKRKAAKRKAAEPVIAADTNSKVKKTPDKSKLRRVSKSPAKPVRKNNQPTENRRSGTQNSAAASVATNDKREPSGRTAAAAAAAAARRSDGGRAERAKRRGESANASSAPAPNSNKSSPVLDQKKARVLAKVAMKTAVPATIPPASSHNKKKGTSRSTSGTTKSAASAVVAAAAAATRAGIKAATRSQGSATGTTAALAAAVAAAAAAASSNTPSTRRAKKGRK